MKTFDVYVKFAGEGYSERHYVIEGVASQQEAEERALEAYKRRIIVVSTTERKDK